MSDGYRVVTRVADQDDFDPTGLADGKALVWSSTTSKWTPASLPVPVVPTANGIQKWTGSAWAAATAGTDYLAPNGNGSALAGITASQIGGSIPGGQISGNIAGNAANVTGVVAVANGGTGQATASAAFNALSPLTALGDLVYASATNTAARLAGNTTTTRKFLRQLGDGTASAAPAWDTLTGADIASGTVAPARLGSGTPGSSNYLRGDGTWAAASGGMAVGSPVTGGAGNRVLFQDASGNLATASGFTYSSSVLQAQTLKATGGIRVDGSINTYNGGEIYFDGTLNTAAVTTAYSGTAIMVFDHKLATSASFSFRVAGVQKLGLDNSGNVTITGGLTQAGVGTFTAGVNLDGSPSAYNGGELVFNGVGKNTAAFTTTYSGACLMLWNHTSATGTYSFRVAGSQKFGLDSAGNGTFAAAVKPGTMTDASAANGSLYVGSDHSNKLCFKNAAGVVTELSA